MNDLNDARTRLRQPETFDLSVCSGDQAVIEWRTDDLKDALRDYVYRELRERVDGDASNIVPAQDV